MARSEGVSLRSFPRPHAPRGDAFPPLRGDCVSDAERQCVRTHAERWYEWGPEHGDEVEMLCYFCGAKGDYAGTARGLFTATLTLFTRNSKPETRNSSDPNKHKWKAGQHVAKVFAEAAFEAGTKIAVEIVPLNHDNEVRGTDSR